MSNSIAIFLLGKAQVQDRSP